MNVKSILEKLETLERTGSEKIGLKLIDSISVNIYPKSVTEYKDALLFLGEENFLKYLFIAGKTEDSFDDFIRLESYNSENEFLAKCELNTKNRIALQKLLDFTKPCLLGLKNSFGFGDRIGLANAGHIRSLKNSNFKPVLAQQSIRELTRTERSPADVMDAAVWAVFQEGYKEGFGADADHLKSKADIDLMVNAGYKMFTLDPSDFVDNQTLNYTEVQLDEEINKLPWEKLSDNYNAAIERYLKIPDRILKILDDPFEQVVLKQALVKYGRAIAHVKELTDHFAQKFSDYTYEIEVSIDETDTVTTPFEHYFWANELNRLNINFVSLAPRFIGAFEKGVDYIGDLETFRTEYLKHLEIVKYFGNYKISLHSGSDKFSVYRVIGSLKEARTHIKTAGTSYLEALKVVAIKEPVLFKQILDFSRDLYETEKRTYHVSADLKKIKEGSNYKNEELETLFENNDLRQILHVTFGRVLTDKDQLGNYIFKDDILRCLSENEELHYNLLIKHFIKHLAPFD